MQTPKSPVSAVSIQILFLTVSLLRQVSLVEEQSPSQMRIKKAVNL